MLKILNRQTPDAKSANEINGVKLKWKQVFHQTNLVKWEGEDLIDISRHCRRARGRRAEGGDRLDYICKMWDSWEPVSRLTITRRW